MTRVLSLLAGACIALPAFAGQQPRDPGGLGVEQRPPGIPQPAADPREGATAIIGVVLSDERPPRPLRRARVALNSPDLSVGRTVIAADDGSFAFERLAPGSYTLAAAKDGYVTLNYGSKRPLRPGVPVAVRRGERRRVRFILTRGSVITGTITHPDGQPAPGIGISAVLYRYESGERRPVSARVTAATDDRGIYRIFGLPAGDYIVAAQGGFPDADGGELKVLSEEDIRRALAEVRDPFARQQSRAPAAPVAVAPVIPEPVRAVRFAPVYYAGTAVANDATFVTVGSAEERAGVDFALDRAGLATVGGTLFTSGGSPPAQIVLTAAGEGPAAGLPRSTTAGPDGQFTFAAVAPGQYMLTTRLIAPRATGPADVAWASSDVFVGGQDVLGVGLTLQASIAITGRVAFDGASPPPKLAGRVPLPGILRSGGMTVPQPSLQLEMDGRFTLSGIVPGSYRLRTIGQGLRSPMGPWWLKSIVVNGREILDRPLDLLQSADDAVVTFSDRATEVRGRLTGIDGNPVTDAFVIVCAADPAAWFFNSRRVAGIRPDADGRYVVRNLPPGDYFVAAADDLEPDEWYDPVVLRRLVNGAARMALAEAEKKTVDVVNR